MRVLNRARSPRPAGCRCSDWDSEPPSFLRIYGGRGIGGRNLLRARLPPSPGGHGGQVARPSFARLRRAQQCRPTSRNLLRQGYLRRPKGLEDKSQVKTLRGESRESIRLRFIRRFDKLTAGRFMGGMAGGEAPESEAMPERDEGRRRALLRAALCLRYGWQANRLCQKACPEPVLKYRSNSAARACD